MLWWIKMDKLVRNVGWKEEKLIWAGRPSCIDSQYLSQHYIDCLKLHINNCSVLLDCDCGCGS